MEGPIVLMKWPNCLVRGPSDLVEDGGPSGLLKGPNGLVRGPSD